MSSITSSTSSLLSQTATTPVKRDDTDNAKAVNSTIDGIYGPAVTLDLTASAQAVVDADSAAQAQPQAQPQASAGTDTADVSTSGNDKTASSSASASSPSLPTQNTANAKAPPPPSPGGGGATVDDVTSDIEKAKREVAALVGIAAANRLVDSKGNIDRIGLAREEAALDQAKQTAS